MRNKKTISALWMVVLVLRQVVAEASVTPIPNCDTCAPVGMTAAQALHLENQMPSSNPFGQFLGGRGWMPTGPLIADPRPALPAKGWVNYTGGELPNAFQRPWSMDAIQLDTYRWVFDQATQSQRLEMNPFNPNFTTSYYDHNEGFLWNSPDAPWNVVAQAWNLPAGSFAIQTEGTPGSFSNAFAFETPPPMVPSALTVSLL